MVGGRNNDVPFEVVGQAGDEIDIDAATGDDEAGNGIIGAGELRRRLIAGEVEGQSGGAAGGDFGCEAFESARGECGVKVDVDAGAAGEHDVDVVGACAVADCAVGGVFEGVDGFGDDG